MTTGVSDKELAVLQLAADVAGGARFATLTGMQADATNMAYRAIHDDHGEVTADALNLVVLDLAKRGLIETRHTPGKGFLVRVTGEGRRLEGLHMPFEDD